MEQHRNFVEEIYHFTGQWEMPSLCGLMIQRKELGGLVLLTELYEDNPGSSVTGMIEPLATRIVKQFGLQPDITEFIVHNPERSSRYEFFAETFYKAHMKWDGERYGELKWEKLEDWKIGGLGDLR
jgi:hypothetical protein